MHDVWLHYYITARSCYKQETYLRLLLFPPWTMDETIIKKFKFKCSPRFPLEMFGWKCVHWGQSRFSRSVVRSACIRHREISRDKFDSSSDFDTFPLQVGCYYFCCTGVKRVGGGAMQVADLSQTNRTDIMNDDERWMGSDTSGTTLRFSSIRIKQISNLNTKVYTIRVRGSSGFNEGLLGCAN
jgi:hypothetical protein